MSYNMLTGKMIPFKYLRIIFIKKKKKKTHSPMWLKGSILSAMSW